MSDSLRELVRMALNESWHTCPDGKEWDGWLRAQAAKVKKDGNLSVAAKTLVDTCEEKVWYVPETTLGWPERVKMAADEVAKELGR